MWAAGSARLNCVGRSRGVAAWKVDWAGGKTGLLCLLSGSCLKEDENGSGGELAVRGPHASTPWSPRFLFPWITPNCPCSHIAGLAAYLGFEAATFQALSCYVWMVPTRLTYFETLLLTPEPVTLMSPPLLDRRPLFVERRYWEDHLSGCLCFLISKKIFFSLCM